MLARLLKAHDINNFYCWGFLIRNWEPYDVKKNVPKYSRNRKRPDRIYFGLCSYDNLNFISCWSVLSMTRGLTSKLNVWRKQIGSFLSWGFVITGGLDIKETGCNRKGMECKTSRSSFTSMRTRVKLKKNIGSGNISVIRSRTELTSYNTHIDVVYATQDVEVYDPTLPTTARHSSFYIV